MDLAAGTVAGALADPATRSAALDALEAHGGPHGAALALAAAPALTDVMCLDTAEVPHALFRRAGLLRGRLMAEAADPPAMYGALLGDGRYARALAAPSVGAGALLSKSAGQLDHDDALSYACAEPLVGGLLGRHGMTRCFAMAGFDSAKDFLTIFMAEEPISSAQRCPADDKPTRMLTLLVELLRSGELPDLAIGGAWNAANYIIQGRPAVARVALELGIVELAAAQLSRAGAPSDWLSKSSRGHLGPVLCAVGQVLSGFAGSVVRPDVDALVSSGLLDQSLLALRAFEEAGVEGLQTTDISGIYTAISVLRKSMSHPTCNAQIRGGAGSAIGFAMEHSLDHCEELGWTTGAYAASLCETQPQFVLRSTQFVWTST